MSADLSATTLHLLVCVTAALALVFALRLLVRRAFGPEIAYLLWVLVPVAAAGALAPAPAVPASLPHVGSLPRIASLPITELRALRGAAAGAAERGSSGGGEWVLICWAFGAAVYLLMQWYQQHRFVRRLAAAPRHGASEWFAAADDVGPVVVGVFPPKVVLPADFHQRYTDREQMLALAHEWMHVARRDPLANFVAVVIRSLLWFHPLVHLAMRYFRFDQELACDAAVLADRPNERPQYARAILKAQFGAHEAMAACSLASRTTSSLKRRILMLRTPTPSIGRRLFGATIVSLVCMASASAAWALQSPQTGQTRHSAKPLVWAADTAVVIAAPAAPVASAADTAVMVAVPGAPVADTAVMVAAPGAPAVDTVMMVAASGTPAVDTLIGATRAPAAPLRWGWVTKERVVQVMDAGAARAEPMVAEAPMPMMQHEPIVILNGERITVVGDASPLNHLDPNGITKIETLNAADAMARYGADASGGAIVITGRTR